MQPWSEPTLADICTRDLIYFDPEYEKVCRRICKVSNKHLLTKLEPLSDEDLRSKFMYHD